MPLKPLTFTTELTAVNRMLSAVGEAPITDYENSTREDVRLAVALLRENTVEVQSHGWRFNREFGYALPASDTLDLGAETVLNIFTPPERLLSFYLTKNSTQSNIDTVLRPPRDYEGAPLVFYDRALNRDGFADRDVLYLDTVWAFDFDDLPETAKRFITIRAARNFVEQHIGATELVGFTIDDEIRALTALEKAEGEEDDYNIFDSADVARVYGRRRLGASGVNDPRISP
jgi:hypothetical protein